MNQSRASSSECQIAASLSQCEAFRRSNLRRDAQAGFLHLLKHLAAEPNTRTARRAIVTAAKEALELALASQDIDSSLDAVRQSIRESISQPQWRNAQHGLAQHLARTVDFELIQGNEAEALELFEMAGRIAKLGVDQNVRFARLAIKLKRLGIDAGELYVEFLEARIATPEEQQEAMKLLREILHVDLAVPSSSEFSQIQRLCHRLWNLNKTPWVAATLALIELRAGRMRDGLAIREQVVDLAACDRNTLLALAVVSYRNRCWADVIALSAACDQNGGDVATTPWSAIGQLLPALARVNLLMFNVSGTPEDWRTSLASDLILLQQSLVVPPYAFDSAWVNGTAHTLLGEHQLALAAFSVAPPEDLCWRYADCVAQSCAALGRRGTLNEEIARWEASAEFSPVFAAILRARAQLDNSRILEAEEGLSVARSALRASDEPDLHLAVQSLAQRLAVCGALSSPLLADPPSNLVNQTSLFALGEFDRARAQFALDHGQFDFADALASGSRQVFGLAHDLRRVAALSKVLRDDEDPAAGIALAQLAAAPEATPQDHLASALWMAGKSTADSAKALAELPEPVFGCMEATLMRFAADNTEETVELPAGWLTETFWKMAPRLSLYRPWSRLVPVEHWASNWPLSPHRAADLLFAAETLLSRDRTTDAVAILNILQHALGDALIEAGRLIAPRLRTAALQFFRRGHFAEACTQHQAALALACDKDLTEERPFAVEVAVALAQFEATPPDPVLEVLVGWLPTWTGDSVELDQQPVGRALQRFLRIDDDVPGDMAAVTRREDWLRRLQSIRPDWDWAKRNLAWAAFRQSQWPAALEHLCVISRPQGVDHFLRGRSHWQMRNFTLAAEAFAAAQSIEGAPQDAAVWRAIAGAAAALSVPANQSPHLSITLALRLEADFANLTLPNELKDDVQLWRSAILLASDQERAAAEVLDAMSPVEPAHFEIYQLLQGLTRLQAGDTAGALVCWPADTADAPQPLRVQALRMWTILRHGDRVARATALESLAEIRRRGVRHMAFNLCEATQLLIIDHPQSALAALSEYNRGLVSEVEPILRPLDLFLSGDLAWIKARALLAGGDLSGAEAQLNQVHGPRAVHAHARMVQAALAEAQGQPDVALRSLEQASDEFSSQTELLARLTYHMAQRQSPLVADRLVQLKAIAPSHPLGILAQAELAEQSDDPLAARQLLTAVWDLQSPFCDARERQLAATKLGRLAELASEYEVAETWWTHATSCGSNGVLPARRLALSRALRGNAGQALPALEEARRKGELDLPLRIVEVVVLVAQGTLLRAAILLEEILKLPEFMTLSLQVRVALTSWCIDLQFEMHRFGAAADALEQLQSCGVDDPMLPDRLDLARLLHIQSLLAQRPLRAETLVDGQRRADQILQHNPKQPLANLLALLCRVIRGECESVESRHIAEELLTLEIPRGPATALVGLLRQSVGLATTLQEDDPSATGDLRIILANQSRQPEPLVELGLKIANGSGIPMPAEGGEISRSSPFADDDLVRLAALAELQRNGEAAAYRLVENWCKQHTPSSDLCKLWVHLLARQAAAALRIEDIDRSQTLLAAAATALSGKSEITAGTGAPL